MNHLLPQATPADTATENLLAVLSRHAPDRSFSSADWRGIEQAARRYRVAGLTLERLRRHGLSAPAEIDAALRDEGRALAARAAGNWWLFDGIAAALTAADIPFIRLKGSHLARCVYESPSHRFQRDFDILVHKKHLNQAQSQIEALGFYRSQDFEGYNLTFKRDGVPFSLELHWDVQRRPWLFDIKVSDLWQRAEPAPDGQGLRLSLEDEIAYLCLHLSKHRFWNEVIPMLDILERLHVQGERVCYSSLKRRFEDWHARKPAALVLSVLTKLFPRDTPTELSRLLPHPPSALTNYACWRVSAPDDRNLEDRKRMVRIATYRKHQRLWSSLLDSEPGKPRRSRGEKVALLFGKLGRLGRSLTLAVTGGRLERTRLSLEKELCEWC